MCSCVPTVTTYWGDTQSLAQYMAVWYLTSVTAIFVIILLLLQFTHVWFDIYFSANFMPKSNDNPHTMHVNGVSTTLFICNIKFLCVFLVTLQKKTSTEISKFLLIYPESAQKSHGLAPMNNPRVGPQHCKSAAEIRASALDFCHGNTHF